MVKNIREYTACWVYHEPNAEVGTVQFVPSELSDVSIEIYEASKFESKASYSLIERFCTAANTRSDIDDRLLKYIVKALEVLIQDGKIELSRFAQALGIKHKANRPKNAKRDIEIYWDVRNKMFEMSYEDACSDVALSRSLSEERIQSIYKDRKRNHLEFLMEMDEYSGEASGEGLNTLRSLIEEEQSDE